MFRYIVFHKLEIHTVKMRLVPACYTFGRGISLNRASPFSASTAALKTADWCVSLPHAGTAVCRPGTGGSNKKNVRMEVSHFEKLLEKVTPIIRKTDTHLRECISPSERLAITLRYMASGMYATLLIFCVS